MLDGTGAGDASAEDEAAGGEAPGDGGGGDDANDGGGDMPSLLARGRRRGGPRQRRQLRQQLEGVIPDREDSVRITCPEGQASETEGQVSYK